MCETVGAYPTAESVFATLISLLEEQWGVKIDYTLEEGESKNEKCNKK